MHSIAVKIADAITLKLPTDLNTDKYHDTRTRGEKEDGTQQTCHYCGYSSAHPTCPARGKECKRCHKMGHFARACSAKTVREIRLTHSPLSLSTSSDESVLSVEFPMPSKAPTVTTLVNNFPVNFVLDTGASVNIISGRVYNGLKHKPPLRNMTTRIFPYRSRQALPIRGFINATIRFRDKACKAKIFVIDSESWTTELT